MTKQEIEEIIRRNIRTNGRGEITARVMAGVLESFVAYTDSEEDKFAILCRELAAAFNLLVQEMENKFENKADALEAALEQFCSNLLTVNFQPWAEALAGALTDKMDLTKSAADNAKTAADGAKDKAIDAKNAADNAKTAADNAKTAADNAKTAADDAKAVAGEAKTAANGAKTAIDDASDGVAAALDAILLGNETPYLSLSNTLTLAGAANFIQALAPVPSGTIAVASDAFDLLEADTTEYEYGGETYTGIIALAEAKGWSVIDSNL